ncbi:conserved hypothetical protein [Planctopirus limnophila DSM 3776]|uniref:Uncharacterized protein n=2 Tax=Planctopirus limnophila TaxID=120 RepID=D5SRF0_PLAL2|nr:conserved hypothetical protein [Planctopirus limnophila DSM 3776]
MCFMLHAASSKPLPSVAWNEEKPAFNATNAACEAEADLRHHLSLKFLKSIGSSTGCGCGFRHAMYQNGDWPEIWFRLDPDTRVQEFDAADLAREAANHEQLADYLEAQLRSHNIIELYGCWEGEWGEPTVHSEALTPATLREEEFVFKERVRYILSADPIMTE